MIKRLLVSVLLSALAIGVAGCGGGAGSSMEPVGVNPTIPSVVQLLSVNQIAQTNTSIQFKAKVLNGNGNVMPDTTVVFTDLSLLGVLSSTSAKTNAQGIATVSLFSSTSGFATLQAEVDTGSGKVRDKRIVFFSIFDMTFPIAGTSFPTLTLDVDSNGNGIFNEPADFTLLDAAGKTQSLIRATVKQSGSPVSGQAVTFTSDSTEATFPTGAVATTDGNGQAGVLMVVKPATSRPISTTLNIMAKAANGAFNVVSFFLSPVTVNTINVSANPMQVASGGSSSITADVITTAGAPIPDGTSVNFSSGGAGGIPPFATTTAGKATVSWTAPTLTAGGANLSYTITASAGGKQGSVLVGVTAPPAPAPTPPPPPPAVAVTPASVTLHCGGGAVATFTITAGTAPFKVYPAISTDPVILGGGSPGGAGDPAGTRIIASVGGQFTVSSAACAGLPASSAVTVTIKDGAIQFGSVTVTVTNP